MLGHIKARTVALGKIIALLVTLLMVVNLQPAMAQRTPIRVDIGEFSNGKPTAELKLDGMHSNSSVGFSIYKKTQVDSAALNIEAAGISSTRTFIANKTVDFQTHNSTSPNTIAESDSVHLSRNSRSLTLQNGFDFQGGESNGLVADDLGVHLVSGSGIWDQRDFSGGPGMHIDDNGTAFDNGQQVDWTYGDGGLRLKYYYTMATDTTSGQPPAERGGMAYMTDPTGKNLYIMGGWTRTGGRILDTYSLDTGTKNWRYLCSPCSTYNPPPALGSLANATMIWNSFLDAPIMTGGDGAPMQVMKPTFELGMCMTYYMYMPSSSLPSPRTGHSEIYDEQDFIAIIFGGRDDTMTPSNSVFTMANDTVWTDRTSEVTWKPIPVNPRYGHSAVWDPVGKKMYVFGGVTGAGQYLNDVWVFDPNAMTFTRLDKISQYLPPPRAFHGAVWNSQAGAMVIIGGRDTNTVLNDIWSYWPNNNTWGRVPITISPSDLRWSMATSFDANRGATTVWGGLGTITGDPTSSLLLKMQGQYLATGQIDSSVINAGTTAQWKSVDIGSSGIYGAQQYGSVRFFMRTGMTTNPGDMTWSQWKEYDFNASLDTQGAMPSQYMQYRLLLTSFTGRQTPVIRNVTICFDTAATSGWLTTGQFDLREVPMVFQNLTIMAWELPFSRTTVSIDVRDNVTDVWKVTPFVDNATLRAMRPARYIRFNISMMSGIFGISSYLVLLRLDFMTVPKTGVYQLNIPHDGSLIPWMQASWTSSDLRPGMGHGSVSIWMSVNNIWIPLFNGQHFDLPLGIKYSPKSVLINITFITDGLSDPVLKSLLLTYESVSLPRDVTVDIGDDKSPELTWPGPHDQGDSIGVTGVKDAITKFIASDKVQPDASGLVLVPISVSSSTAGLIILKDLEVHGTLANAPPNITSIPPLKAEVGIDYRYEVQVSNKDLASLNFTVVKGPAGMLFGGHVLLWTPDQGQAGAQNVIISVSDGFDTTFQSFTITVDSTSPGHPPIFNSWPDGYDKADGTVRLKYGDKFHYQVQVVDPHPGDKITLYLEQGPNAMALDQKLMVLNWGPTDKDINSFTVVLRASDGRSSAYQTFRIIVQPNKAPQFDTPVPALSVKAGKSLSYAVKASDKDGDPLKYTLLGAPVWMSIDNQGVIHGSPGQNSVGKNSFTVVLSDGHLNTTQDVTVEVMKDTTIGGMAQDDLMALLIILLIICIVIIVVALVVVRARRKKAAAKKAILEAPPAPTVPAPVPPAQPAPRPARPPPQVPPAATVTQMRAVEAPVAEVAKEEKPIIEEIYLIYNDGRLIAHESAKGTVSMDEHVLSGMLKAIQEFVKDSFQKEGALGGLDYGDSRIMLESGNCATFAIVLKGKETKALREETKRAIERIEGLYAGVIECWDGDSARFEDVKKYFGPIFALGKTQEEQAEAGDVKILSQLEFYQGYVRLKAAVKNNYPYMVYDVDLKIIYDKKALQLDHIEPEYEREGSEIVIGNIPPNEKKTVAFYLDPIICMESSIDATAIFKNYKGELKTVLMKRRPVDIVCPIFYTEQNVNVAMLKRLVTELRYKDSKIFAIPKTLLPTEAMKMAKAVVESRDVKFVREFFEETPYIGEAWFYGKTKHTLEDLTIRATVREDRGLLEFFVASNNLATLPGLLADLGHGLKKRYAEVKRTKEGLTQVTDIKIKDELEKSRLLIDKYVSTEAPALTDETDL